MLQTRYENEQFNSFGENFTNNRSRNGLVTTDRPDSSQRVDLHVYLIPTSVWKNVQNLAQNEAMDDAISAGFVRVSPEQNLRDLRQSIEKLCSNETYFPRDFIFLRSVGRCLTRVKPRQEFDLKVKNYRPPQTFAPEIYLLEGKHEDHSNIPAASPALSSASYLFGNHYQNLLPRDQLDSSTKLLKHIPIKTVRSEKNPLPNLKIPRRPSQRNVATNFNADDFNFDNSSMHELMKVKEEQERLRQRQLELEQLHRTTEEKQKKNKRREVRSEEIEGKIRSTRRQPKLELERARREEEEEEKAATRIQASFRGFKSRQAIKERQKRVEFPKRENEEKQNRPNDNERRKRDLTKKNQRQNVESLKIRLQQLRSQCTDLENVRNDVIKSLKTIHQRIMIRRKETRDIWKKKYYQEKKKTPPLEEQNENLKTELQTIQKKIIQTIENENKHLVQTGHAKELPVDDFILRMTQNQHEIENARYKIEQAKVRLTTDIKLRRQAEQECQLLKYELDQAKMNLSHFKVRQEN